MVCILGWPRRIDRRQGSALPHARMPRGVQDGVMTQMLLEVCCAHALRSEGQCGMVGRWVLSYCIGLLFATQVRRCCAIAAVRDQWRAAGAV